MRAPRPRLSVLALSVAGACSGGGSRDLTPPTTQCFDVAAVTSVPAPAPLWTQLQPTGTPPAARVSHAAALDAANDRMIVFGGFSTTALNDVWVLTNATGVAGTPAWSQLSPTGTPPVPRHSSLAAYDPASNRLAIYGGIDQSNLIVNDYWILTNANGLGGTPVWSQITPVGLPGVRGREAGAVDASGNRLFAFGGLGCGSSSCTLYNDAFVTANVSGTPGAASFTRLAGAGATPQSRYNAAMGYDVAGNRLLVFGGQTSTSLTSDPTLRVDDAWALSSANGSGGTATWSAINATTKPPGREGHSAIYDALSSRLVIFGGAGTDNFTRSDTWTLATTGTTGAWMRYAATSNPAPRARSQHSAVYAPQQSRMVVFGGNLGSSNYVNEVWVLSLTNSAVASVTILSAASTICANNTIKLVAVPRDATGTVLDVTVTWTTTDQTVVTVGPDGTVYGVAPGTAGVVACVGAVCSAPLSVKVTVAVNPPTGGTASSSLAIPTPQSQEGCVDTNGGRTTNVVAATLIAWGGAPTSGYSWSLTPGSVYPPGVTVELLTGIVKPSGGTLVAGNYNFNMTVSDGSRTATGNIAFQVSTASSATFNGIPGVGCASALFQQSNLSTIVLPNARVGSGYGASLYVTVGSFLTTSPTIPTLTWSLAGGALPPGLVIDQARGVVRGTPNSSASGQTYSFTISVRDSQGRTALVSGAGAVQYKITVQ